MTARLLRSFLTGRSVELGGVLRIGAGALIATLFVAAATHAMPVKEPTTGHTYELIQDEVDKKAWADARAAAEAQSTGGRWCHLATITSQAENDFVVAHVLPTTGVDAWIGAEQPEPLECTSEVEAWAMGKWVTGEPWEYTNWSTSDGAESGCNERCLTYGEDYVPPNPPQWENDGCASRLSYLIECEPRVVAPALSVSGVAALAALVFASGCWILLRRRTTVG